MTRKKDIILLERYYSNGFLDKKYYLQNNYYQPYSGLERLKAGLIFYQDFIFWQKGNLRAIDFTIPKVDYTYNFSTPLPSHFRFHNSLKKLSRPFIPILYKIILEQQEIKPPPNISKRERLYFNDEIKTLLCRGLDELISYYQQQ